jgi:hypothetical protein
VGGGRDGGEEVRKAILGMRNSTVDEVVMGELGWWTMKARRDLLRLLYWREIVSRKKGLRWEVYQEERETGNEVEWRVWGLDLEVLRGEKSEQDGGG